MKPTARITALTAAAIAGFALAGCGGSAHTATIRVHGTFAESGPVSGNCGYSPGDQVRITTTAGRLLASPLLGNAETRHIRVAGNAVSFAALPYAASVPAEPRYGLSTGSMPVYYVSQSQLRRGVDLSC